jgi:hypothetical protein
MKIELWPLSRVKSHRNNPRRNDDAGNALVDQEGQSAVDDSTDRETLAWPCERGRFVTHW